jgi:glyoxylase-like metal-dependent hydrolase (beta-lactamase superfamily II)
VTPPEDLATPHPPATAEFGAVKPDGPPHHYPSADCERITKFSVGALDNNVYVIRCTGSGEAVIIDGSAGPERVLQELEGFRPVAIVITHNHRDHTRRLKDLVDALKVPVFAHPADAPLIPVPTEALEDGTEIRVGTLMLRALHTPGHTPGATSLLLGAHLFSGDALFPGGPGATPGPLAFQQAIRSVERLFALPDETRVSPGHGLDTTVGRERPYLEAWKKRGW